MCVRARLIDRQTQEGMLGWDVAGMNLMKFDMKTLRRGRWVLPPLSGGFNLSESEKQYNTHWETGKQGLRMTSLIRFDRNVLSLWGSMPVYNVCV